MPKLTNPTPPIPPLSLQGLDAADIAARCGTKQMLGYDELATHPAMTFEEQAYFAASVAHTMAKAAYKAALALEGAA